MDDFRKLQKLQCSDGAPKHGYRPYGCSCCRLYATKRRFKKYTRKLAKVRFRRQTKTEFCAA